MLTIERSLNVYAAGIPQIINLNQYDDDFQLVFALYTSEGTFTAPSGTTAEIMGTKVDGNGYSADATISGNTVTVTGNNQMTACAGRNVFEIVLTNSGKRLATINFVLQVERAALDADTIQSETVLKELQAIIDSAATSTQAAQDAEDAADRAEEAARSLTVDPTLTQPGQPADAKVTGDEINDLKEDFEQFEGISDEVKQALLGCFAKVAWIDEHGQDYYDALQTALYGSTEDWTWKYESSSGQLLSQNANVSNAEFSSGVTESIVNGKLRIVQSATGAGQLSRYRLLPTTNTKARLAARVRFVTIPLANPNSGTGFRLQLSNASSNGSGVQIFERKDVNDNKYYWVVFEGQTARTLTELDTGIWYTIEVERTETKQKIYIDNQLIFESTTMSENYTNSNQILLQSGGPSSDPPQAETFIVDIEWVAYKNLDIES